MVSVQRKQIDGKAHSPRMDAATGDEPTGLSLPEIRTEQKPPATAQQAVTDQNVPRKKIPVIFYELFQFHRSVGLPASDPFLP